MSDHAVPSSEIVSPALVPAAATGDPLAAEDPQGAMRAALAGAFDPTIPPEDMVLGWVLRLPETLDPAIAARQVIAAASAASVANLRLLALLAEVASWPTVRLRRLGAPRPRLTQ